MSLGSNRANTGSFLEVASDSRIGIAETNHHFSHKAISGTNHSRSSQSLSHRDALKQLNYLTPVVPLYDKQSFGQHKLKKSTNITTTTKMPKERSINPVAAQHKADKKQQLKKSKQNVQAQRNEKLARRNPERLQRQIDDLKSLATTQQLRPKDQATLDQLEKDLRAVRKARDVLGEKAPAFAKRREGGGVQEGRKRRRVEEEDEDETDEDVRNIPMPKDTPPPVPRRNQPHQLPNKPAVSAAPVVAQTTYSSAPVLRNLKEESRKFVPTTVAQNITRQKGQGGRLLEPEEADKLEKAGYNDARKVADEMEKEAEFEMMGRGETAEKALRHVEMEEVEDEGI
ncbi:hypothetical protein D6D21_08286 [Aureobasidium pullulans]|uniref:Wbp11/ELF5/Saf1 N-terminal domain-containing protein n=1 Tax=Aureobasidium pullulans TaxID=5580 RepID=A0AB74IP16_AURPU|nr:hypothetical protein D6D21_08286 [Aureobasidium pullulans]